MKQPHNSHQIDSQSDSTFKWRTAVCLIPLLFICVLLILATPGASAATEYLYGTAQACNYGITNPANSIDGAFNDQVATCTGLFAQDTNRWIYTAVTDTTLTSVQQVTLEIRFFITGWTDDRIDIQVHNGASWTRIDRFEGGQKSPPGTLSTLTYDVSSTLTTLTEVNAARIRIRGRAVNATADNITIHMDGARLLVDDTAAVPTPTPGPSPTPSPTSVPGNSPHGNFNVNHDTCATCHRIHTGKSAKLIYTVAGGNAFCYSCHDGSGASPAPVVSTHANTDYIGGVEASFTLLCTQCHNPHGSPNRTAVREYVVVQPGSNPLKAGPVNFTATTGLNSYDDGSSAESSRICVTCHVDANNSGFPMVNHTGGANHQGGFNFVGQDCTACHPHSADNDYVTNDGFMPAGGCVGCHSVPQNNGDGIPAAGRREIVSEFGLTSHHVTTAVTDSDCAACHNMDQHKQGYVRLYEADNPANIITLNNDLRTNPTEMVKLEPFCLSCHDADGAGGAAPFADGVMPPVKDSTLWAASAHQNSGSATCFNCHDNGHGSNKSQLLAPYATGPGTGNVGQEEGLCYTCHDGGVAATDVQAEFGRNSHHNVSATDQADGSKVECANCHDPHEASSANKLADPDTGAVWTGPRTNFCLACHDGTPPAGVTFAGGGNGTAVSTHSNVNFNGVEQNFVTECSQCHQGHGTDNLSLIQQFVQVQQSPVVNVGPVVFTAVTGPNSFDDGVSSSTSRICVACHADGSNPGYPMANHNGGAGHNGGLDFTSNDCTACHPHNLDTDSATQDGFMVDASCVGCHQVAMGGRRAVVPEFGNTSHHVQGAVDDADCQMCHDNTNHQSGQVVLRNVDTGVTIPYTGLASLEPFCLACHDGNGAGGAAPFTDGQMPPVIDQPAWSAASHANTYTCADCHDNGHGSIKNKLLGPYNATPDGNPADPLRQEERFCYLCHDGTATVINMQAVFNQTTHHDVEQNAPNSYVECNNCHNPHMNNNANKASNPDDTNQLWAPGNETAFCLACHDGAPPAGVTFPATSPGTGFNKLSYVNSTHDSNLRNYGCRHCHDQHGSPNVATLLDTYVVTDFNPYGYGNGDYALCFGCHVEDDVVMDSGGGRATNAFDDRHDKHVDGESSPCVVCHDAHAPWDAGEAGLISLDVGFNDGYGGYDFPSLEGRTLSTAFYISGGQGGCYLSCHGTRHTPETYNRTPNPSVTCATCHPGGPPAPAAAMPVPLAIELGVPLGTAVTPTPMPTAPPPIVVTATPVP